ncbi:hypothetical protein [Azospirillum sp. TSO35-2]|uniref:hypothetical protein n=1 Tax=Azospirillum sp. TSO35-2 TaxID=716796 RepID=UPI000D659D16|nr:hypothetical protein [Azospirillum sp. TSO35-2]
MDTGSGVIVHLSDDAIEQGGHAEGDVLTGIENVAGSAHGDRLTDGDGANALRGGADADTIPGGAGLDTAS